MTAPTAAEQVAAFATTTFKDGEASDGSPTAEETAAAAANAPPATDATDETADDTLETEDDGTETPAEDDEQASAAAETPEAKAAKEAAKTEKKGGKKSFSERLGDVTAARRQAERDLNAERAETVRLRAENEALKSGKAPLTAAQDEGKGGAVPPDPSQFDYGELDPKYIAALARHETAQALKAAKADDDKARQADAAAATQREQATKRDALLKAGVKQYEDFDEVVFQGAQEGKYPLSETLGQLLVDSEFGPQIVYELAKDPDEAERVYKLSPGHQAAYFGRQEAKFEAAKPSQASKTPKAPQAPPPPKTPKGGSGSNKVGADSADFAAVEKAWRGGAL